MRYSSILAAALATAPLAVSATGKLGYALGSRLTGKLFDVILRLPRLICDLDGSCKTQPDYAADLSVLKDVSKLRGLTYLLEMFQPKKCVSQLHVCPFLAMLTTFRPQRS